MSVSVTPCKITDLMKTAIGKSYSIEITPNIREDELITEFEVEPLFYSITWHANQHECRDFDIPPLKLAKFLRKRNKNVLLHISCSFLRRSYVDDLLIMLQEEGICNLFVILGENYNADKSDFRSTQELISHIRAKTGEYFCIGVAAFPDREDNLKYLTDKIDCGANFIITQVFFDVEKYGQFLNKCISSGITVPILPGIFPFEHEKELIGFINKCKINVSKQVLEDVKNTSGYEVVGKQINDLCSILKQKHFHYFTLDNTERVKKINKTWISLK